MNCPFCSHPDSKVIDSRVGKDGESIRRRRECEACNKRFTTYERVEDVFPFIVKKDGRREPYDRSKVISGLQKACEKRPVSVETIERVANGVETALMESGERELPSAWVGERVMEALKKLDDVAYVRFASVYRSFKDIGEFMELIRDHAKTGEAESSSF